MNIKPILIVAGEPNSIFSEIFFKSLKKYNSKKPIILIASKNLFEKQMKYLGFSYKFNDLPKNFKIEDIKKGKIINILDIEYKFKTLFSKITENSKEYIDNCFIEALKISKRVKISGLINGPISKKNYLDKKFPGITEFIAKKTKAKNFAMLIFNERFSVNPITTHIPIHKVHKLISKKKIIENVNLIKKFYRNVFKIDATIFITGLNPHCETNYEKNEENRIIIPAIRQLKKKYKNIEGPFAADSLFMKNNIKKYNVVIGMYHDQVLTPIKSLVNFKAINLTLGLPFLRISPDHGPNENMMGKNISNPESLIECIKFLNQKCI